ncbi:hypothetical protein KBX08_32760, partial [Micromonospora sp. H61]|uniref:hypothetical protein n=1 Tax=Micromonospora sp. H61 TaxID=2824888 RepID=UPI001B364E2C
LGDVGAGAALPPQWKPADTGYLMTTTYRADSDTTPPSPYTARLQTSGGVVTAIVLDLEGQVAASGRLTTADAFGIVGEAPAANPAPSPPSTTQSPPSTPQTPR